MGVSCLVIGQRNEGGSTGLTLHVGTAASEIPGMYRDIALEVRKSEGLGSVASISGSKQREQRRIL